MSAAPIKLVATLLVFCVLGVVIWLQLASRDDYSDIARFNIDDTPEPIQSGGGFGDSDKSAQVTEFAERQIELAQSFDQMSAHINRGEYGQAVEVYSAVYSELSEPESERYRQSILSRASHFSLNGEHNAVISLLGEYTGLFFKDVSALKLLAESQHHMNLYPEEIDTLLLALNEAHLHEDIVALNRAMDSAVIAQDLVYVQANDPDSAVTFYQDLLLSRPESAQLHFGLIRATIRTGDIDTALAALEQVPNAVEHADQIDRLREMALAGRPPEGTSIPLQRAGNGFVVDATINGSSNVKLLIDTGATLTIIRPEALTRAGIGTDQAIRVSTLLTAGGNVNTPIYRLESLSLGGEKIAGINVGSIDLAGMKGIDGLLGMNYLGQFRFTLDQKKPTILLLR